MTNLQWILKSPIGNLYLVASRDALKKISWNKQRDPIAKSLKGTNPALKILKITIQQLEEYFEGKRRKFDIPIDVHGSPFQVQVWNQLKKIPYGKTYSYKKIAKKIKNEKAVRAVGTANGKNPISIIVPCHRVIAANGTLGGYAGGLSVKEKLLELEQGNE